MKKQLIAIALTAGILSLGASTSLLAQDTTGSTSTTADGGQCPSGGCHGGDKKHDKEDKGTKPAPSPSPVR
jgi:hypothetical protein